MIEAIAIRIPMLVQRSVAGPMLPQEIQCKFTAAFKNAQVRVIACPDLGHKLIMKDAMLSARDTARYLNGEDVGGPRDSL